MDHISPLLGTRPLDSEGCQLQGVQGYATSDTASTLGTHVVAQGPSWKQHDRLEGMGPTSSAVRGLLLGKQLPGHCRTPPAYIASRLGQPRLNLPSSGWSLRAAVCKTQIARHAEPGTASTAEPCLHAGGKIWAELIKTQPSSQAAGARSGHLKSEDWLVRHVGRLGSALT